LLLGVQEMSKKARVYECPIKGCGQAFFKQMYLDRHLETCCEDKGTERRLQSTSRERTREDIGAPRRRQTTIPDDNCSYAQLQRAGEVLVDMGPDALIEEVTLELMKSVGLPHALARAGAVIGRTVASDVAAMKMKSRGAQSADAVSHKSRLKTWAGQSRRQRVGSSSVDRDFGAESVGVERGRKRQCVSESSGSEESSSSGDDGGHNERSRRSESKGSEGKPVNKHKKVMEESPPRALKKTDTETSRSGSSTRSVSIASSRTRTSQKETTLATTSEVNALKEEVRQMRMSLQALAQMGQSDRSGAKQKEHGRDSDKGSLTTRADVGDETKGKLGEMVDLIGVGERQVISPPARVVVLKESSRMDQQSATMAIHGVSAASKADVAYVERITRLFVHDPQRKNEWHIDPNPDTKVMVIGDSNLRLVPFVPKGWEVHVLPGGRLEHVCELMRTFPVDSALKTVVIQVGINHRDDRHFPRGDLTKLRDIADRARIRLLMQGVAIAPSMPQDMIVKLNNFNEMVKGMFAKWFVYPLRRDRVFLDRGDRTCVHYDEETVSDMMFKLSKRLFELHETLEDTYAVSSSSVQRAHGSSHDGRLSK